MPTVSKFVWELHLDQFVKYHYKNEKIGIKINVLIKWTSNNIMKILCCYMICRWLLKMQVMQLFWLNILETFKNKQIF